jgi:hypothetical protein
MKPKELNDFINSIVAEEVKNTILEESMEGGKKVYHIKSENEPVDTFDTPEEAYHHLDLYKKDHPGKQFIIEKGIYESHSDMIEKLDAMGEQIEQNESNNMKKSPVKVKSIAEAILHAKENGIKKVRINEEVFDVAEAWEEMEKQEGKEEEMSENDDFASKKWGVNHKKSTAGMPELPEKNPWDEKEEDGGDEKKEPKKGVDLGKSFEKFKKETKEEEECDECGGEEISEAVCEKCGKEPCECVVKESKKKSVRITEAQLINVISNIVKESSESIPGVSVTKKAQAGSKKENDANATAVGKKMKDYLSFDGNDNPEFPKQIGKGEKIAINNTKEEESVVDDNRGRGPENLVYDQEPSKKFKERMKGSLEGDTKMGNSTDSTKIQKKDITNGGDVGDTMDGNGTTIKTDTGKKINKLIPTKEKEKKEEPRYKKEPVPVKVVKESTGIKFSTLVEEELVRMNRLTKYNNKTQ